MSGYKSVSYYVNWAIYGRNHQPQDIPYTKLTHVLYSFANLRDNGEVFLTDPWSDTDKHYPGDSWNDPPGNVYGCIKQLYLLKKKNRHLKILLSVGGWTYSPKFAAPMSTAQGRATFASSAVRLVQDLGLDGIDIDWEYPADDGQAADFASLLKTTRHALDAYTAQHGGNRQLLTIACPAGPANYEKLHLRAMTPHLDFYNLMGYDFAGSWDQCVGHQANLFKSASNPASTPFSVDQAVRYYRDQGVPAEKIVLGMPLYGRAFQGTKGFGTPFSGVGEGSWENGVWDYKALPREGAEVCYDREAEASFSFDRASGMVVSFDSKEAVERKTRYVCENGLGGGMWWESSSDKPGSESLIATAFEGLKGSGSMDTTENTLSYPASKYGNIKNGMPNE
ncbi:MAG: Endochitinase 1 [Stictis urceolatum]|nr:Endochitinase 1 [Stictis urceolata]